MTRIDPGKIKVCMVAHDFYPSYAGGARQALSLCQKLRERGISTFVVTRNYDSAGIGWQKEKVQGVTVFRIRCYPRKGLLAGMLFHTQLLLFLIAKRSSYSILHCHYIGYHSFVAFLAAKLLKAKAIGKMAVSGGDDPQSIGQRNFGSIQLKLTSLADRIVSISSELSTNFKSSQLPGRLLVEIPNGVNVDIFKPLSAKEKGVVKEQLGLATSEAIVSFVGIVKARKGLGVLIKSWKRVTAHNENVKLLIIGPKSVAEHPGLGSNAYLNGLVAELKRNNLCERVCFTGHVHNVHQYLQVSDIFVLPTEREGLPNSLLEAMSCGLPCIATKLPPTLDIIHDGNDGLLFEYQDEVQLAEHITRLLNDDALKKAIGKAARETMLGRFSLSAIADRYIQLYEELLKR